MIGKEAHGMSAGQMSHKPRQRRGGLWADNEMPMVGHHTIAIQPDPGLRFELRGLQDREKSSIIGGTPEEREIRGRAIVDVTDPSVDTPSSRHGSLVPVQAA